MLEDMTEEVFIFAQCPKCFIFCEWNVGLCVCTFVCMFMYESVCVCVCVCVCVRVHVPV